MKKKVRSGKCTTPYRMQQGRHAKQVTRHDWRMRQPRQTPCRRQPLRLPEQLPAQFDQQMPPLQPERLPLPCLQPILPDSTCIFDCETCLNLFSSNTYDIPSSVFPFALALSTKRDNAGAPFWLSPRSAALSKRYN